MIDCAMSALSFCSFIIEVKSFLTRFTCFTHLLVLHITQFWEGAGLVINVLYSESRSQGSSAGVTVLYSWIRCPLYSLSVSFQQ